MSGILGTLGSVIGIGSGAKNLFGGSQQGGSGSSNTYVPTGLGSADQSWQSALSSALGLTNQTSSDISPILQQAFQSMLGVSPTGYTNAANQAGSMYGQLGQNTAQDANTLRGQAANAYGGVAPLQQAGQSVWNTAQDPQNALRAQLQQQVTDASRAGTSARGIGMGGEAAGIENQAINNFLTNWQNQQLQRQISGAGALGSAYDASGRQAQLGNSQLAGAADLGSQAPQYTLAGGSTPYNAQLTAAQQPFNASSLYQQGSSGLLGQYGGILSSIIPYLNSGQGATNQAFGQQQTGMNNLTTGLNQLGKSSAGNWLSNLFGNTAQPQQPYQYTSDQIPGAGYNYNPAPGGSP